MTSRPGRPRAALVSLTVALVLCVLAPARGARGADDEPVSPSNALLLLDAARAVARSLIAQAPLTPGTRVGLRREAGEGINSDALDALVMALNERRIECVVLEPLGAEGTGGVTGEGTVAPDTAGIPPGTSKSTDLGQFTRLQAERMAQAARADSIARARAGTAPPPEPAPAPAPTPGAGSVMANGGAAATLAVMTYRVPEARVDYVRVYRGGLFGAERIERRATARMALRLFAPGGEAVRWSATADTSLGDVVMKSEIATLEDRTRPETRPIPPSSSIKKYIEPALVVILIAGLVSLFYQNRP
jgi:hypothetical protein